VETEDEGAEVDAVHPEPQGLGDAEVGEQSFAVVAFGQQVGHVGQKQPGDLHVQFVDLLEPQQDLSARGLPVVAAEELFRLGLWRRQGVEVGEVVVVLG
jgi:hypothetical protein